MGPSLGLFERTGRPLQPMRCPQRSEEFAGRVQTGGKVQVPIGSQPRDSGRDPGSGFREAAARFSMAV